jgi:hypothetical protein
MSGLKSLRLLKNRWREGKGMIEIMKIGPLKLKEPKTKEALQNTNNKYKLLKTSSLKYRKIKKPKSTTNTAISVINLTRDLPVKISSLCITSTPAPC